VRRVRSVRWVRRGVGKEVEELIYQVEVRVVASGSGVEH
jgi:hypothetical protein